MRLIAGCVKERVSAYNFDLHMRQVRLFPPSIRPCSKSRILNGEGSSEDSYWTANQAHVQRRQLY